MTDRRVQIALASPTFPQNFEIKKKTKEEMKKNSHINPMAITIRFENVCRRFVFTFRLCFALSKTNRNRHLPTGGRLQANDCNCPMHIRHLIKSTEWNVDIISYFFIIYFSLLLLLLSAHFQATFFQWLWFDSGARKRSATESFELGAVWLAGSWGHFECFTALWASMNRSPRIASPGGGLKWKMFI